MTNYSRQDSPGHPLKGRVVLVITILLVLLLAAGVVVVSKETFNQSVQANLYAWENPADDVLPITVEIVRDRGIAVTCELIAVDDRHIIVGQLTLDVPAGDQEHIRVSADIPLQADAVAPQLRECRAKP